MKSWHARTTFFFLSENKSLGASQPFHCVSSLVGAASKLCQAFEPEVSLVGAALKLFKAFCAHSELKPALGTARTK